MADAQELSRISTLAQLDDLLRASSQTPVWLFKHSLICSTSTDAWHEFERFVAGRSDEMVIGVIEIQRARDVSKEVAVRTGVRHESPQVLLIRDGRPVWQASHWAITVEALEAATDRFVELETANAHSRARSQ
jgi:bacillithiol system protein YtxJ